MGAQPTWRQCGRTVRASHERSPISRSPDLLFRPAPSPLQACPLPFPVECGHTCTLAGPAAPPGISTRRSGPEQRPPAAPASHKALDRQRARPPALVRPVTSLPRPPAGSPDPQGAAIRSPAAFWPPCRTRRRAAHRRPHASPPAYPPAARLKPACCRTRPPRCSLQSSRLCSACRLLRLPPPLHTPTLHPVPPAMQPP